MAERRGVMDFEPDTEELMKLCEQLNYLFNDEENNILFEGMNLEPADKLLLTEKFVNVKAARNVFAMIAMQFVQVIHDLFHDMVEHVHENRGNNCNK